MIQWPSEKPLATAPVFRFSEWGTQFWVCIQHVFDFLWGFFVHLFPFRLSLVCLHYREIVISFPLGFEAQLIPIVLDVWLLLQGFVHLGKETVLGPHLTQHDQQMGGFRYQQETTEGHNSRKRCSRLHVWSFEPARLTYEPFQDQPTQQWATNNVESDTHLSCLSPSIRASFSLVYLSLLRPRPDSMLLALWCGPSFHPNPFGSPVWEPRTWQRS